MNASWEHLYAEGSYPTLDQTVRIEDDVSPNFAEANAGFYSNFKRVATWTPQAGSGSAGAAVVLDQTLPSGPALTPFD